MAFLDSINFNGKSIRDFLTEIIEVRGRGKPRIRKRSSRIIGRHGDFTFGQTYAPRIIRISGYVEGISHATLMLNVDNIKNLFSMDDQILSTGEESISDGVKYGKLVFGDETDRYYRAIYNGINVLTEISQRWFLNDLKRIQIELRCDDPFAYATSLSESTMAGSADEFKVFDLGTANNEVIIELSGSVTNPIIVEGDKVGVAHFDYDDDLTDVEVNTVVGNFEEIFGFRTRKSLTSQQSKAIQLVSKDNLFYDRGANINGQNYVNINPNQGTMIFWVKPYFDGDDSIEHAIFRTSDAVNNGISLIKLAANTLRFQTNLAGTVVTINSVALNPANFGAGKWHQIVARWDRNNGISGTANTAELEINQGTPVVSTSAMGTPSDQDQFFAIGQTYSTTPDGSQSNFDGLIYYELFERALTDSEVTALFNSGAGVEPFVTPDTKLLSAGELSGGIPVSVQYPWVDNKFTDGGQEVDPAAEWGVSAGTVVISAENTIVKYDLQSAKIVWTSALTNAFANTTTVVLVNNQDYFYRFWIYVETLNASDELHLDIVGDTTVHTRRLDTGIDDMGVTFATGKWLYYEGTFEADGSTAHEFRIRKLNVNGDATVYVDQMDVQVNKMNNAPFEGTYVAGLAPGWTKEANTTVTEVTVNPHSGSSSQQIESTSGSSGITQSVSVSANTWLLVSIWARTNAGTGTLIMQHDLTGGNPGVDSFRRFTDEVTTTWQKFYMLVRAVTGETRNFRIRAQSGEGTIVVDDITYMELDKVTANAGSAPTSEIDSYSEEKFKQGLRIDGADVLSWIIVGNKNEGSIEVWFKPNYAADWDDDTDDPLVVLLQDDNDNYLRIVYDWTTNRFVFTKATTLGGLKNASSQDQTFAKGDRIHIIATYGASGVIIYVDSVLGAVSSADTNPLNDNPTFLQLKASFNANNPDNIYDELYVYSRELSQQEVTAKFNAIRATKNDNAKIAMTKVLNTNDKLRIDTENEVIEFLDSSAATFTNAIASMDAGSNFFKMHANKSVIYNKVALTNGSVVNKIKLNYLKRWL